MERVEISHENTMELIKKAQNGDIDIQNFLVENNIGLVRSVVKRFLNRGCEYEDLIQIGSIGLLKAIKKFDISYDVKFSTYAVPMIIGEIKRFLRDDGLIKVSRNLKELSYKANAMIDNIEKKTGKEPTISELAVALDVEQEDLVMALESTSTTQHLFDTIHQEEGSAILLIDKIESGQDEDLEIINKLALRESIRLLEKRERQIIIMRYFMDKTQCEVARELGVSQVQISRIEKKIIDKIRDNLI